MADFVVTMVLQKVNSLLDDKVNLLKGVDHDVLYISEELEGMVALLRWADGSEEKDEELKVWVNQVRQLAENIEDSLDTYALLQPRYHLNHPIINLLNKLFFCVKNLPARYEVASEIRTIKSRVNDISQRHQRYSLMYNLQLRAAKNSVDDCRGDALLLEEGELVGIDGPKKELIRFLLEDSCGLRVLAVVGMGGAGKSTLVRQVYNDGKTRKHFNCHAWITGSQSLKAEDVLRDMIQQLFKEVNQPLPENLITMDSNRLKAMAKEFLLQKRYMVVFDDVWRIEDWNLIKHVLPKGSLASRAILTTRKMDVASSSIIESGGRIYEVRPLSEEDSWKLFCQKTFPGGSCPLHLQDICRSILKRNEGLPLAIRAISGVLAAKHNASIDEWVALSRSLGAELAGNERLESTKKVLLMSFNDLPYYLKPCFQYMSIYPEDHRIEHNTLVQLWIVEGLVSEKEGRTLEEVAEGYLNELINRSLIRTVKSNSDGSLRVGGIHDFYREIVLSKSREQNFVTIATENQQILWPNKSRRISIHGSLGEVPVGRYDSRLHSLLCFGLEEPVSIRRMLQLLHHCIMVKVLDLSGVPLDSFPKAVLGLLHLRYLSLRNTGIKQLPKSINKLQNLEVLDLKGTLITELPIEILELQLLRHLLVYRYIVYSYAPFHNLIPTKAIKGMGRLRRLQKLSFIEVSPESGIIGELKMMHELRRLGITNLRKEDGPSLCGSIQKLQKLRALDISSRGEDEFLDLSYLSSPPPYLQRLYLCGLLEKLPDWVSSLHYLVKIYLRFSRLLEDPLVCLEDLPCLVHIEFNTAFFGERLCFRAGKFQKLRRLSFDRLERLRWVEFEQGSSPFLDKLIVQKCYSLERVPFGIEFLEKLKHLEFFEMPEHFLDTFLPGKRGEDYWRVSHIDEVYYTHWAEGWWHVCSLDYGRDDDGDENVSRHKVAFTMKERRNCV